MRVQGGFRGSRGKDVHNMKARSQARTYKKQSAKRVWGCSPAGPVQGVQAGPGSRGFGVGGGRGRLNLPTVSNTPPKSRRIF